MLRWLGLIVLTIAVVAGCGQKGPLVLPQEERRKPVQPPAHDLPPTPERRQ